MAGSERKPREASQEPSRSSGRLEETKTTAPPLTKIVLRSSPREIVTRPERPLISSHCRRSAREKVSSVPSSVFGTAPSVWHEAGLPRGSSLGAGVEMESRGVSAHVASI